jgi:pilus assembly protein Flp/PilA
MPFCVCVRSHTQQTVERDRSYMSILRNVLRNEEGATMVEYGVMVALIAAVCIAVITTLGQNVNNAFSTVNASL